MIFKWVLELCQTLSDFVTERKWPTLREGVLCDQSCDSRRLGGDWSFVGWSHPHYTFVKATLLL